MNSLGMLISGRDETPVSSVMSMKKGMEPCSIEYEHSR